MSNNETGVDQPTKRSMAQKRYQKRVEFLLGVTVPERKLRICDVGANPIHMPDYAGLLDLAHCEVWGFEPAEGAFQALLQNPKTGAHYIQKAVGRGGKAKFFNYPHSGLSSIFRISKSSVRYLGVPGWFQENVKPCEIEVVALDDISDQELPKPDVLKIDIQGGELDVFQTGRKKMSDAVCVIPEVRFYRLYEKEPLFGEVDTELHDQGFVLHKFLSTKRFRVHNSQRHRMKNKVFRNQILDGDAVYIRNPENMAEWTNEQVRQLATASAGVFASYDLTVACLDELAQRGVVDNSAPQKFVDLLPAWMKNVDA
ncbi:MAG: FkbM family methyltransferase [Pseudomonadota bacterium]